MQIDDKKTIEANLERALQTKGSLLCVIKDGLTESSCFFDQGAVLYTQIIFAPYLKCYEFYCGRMYYPNNKDQGLMDFPVDSFLSAICLEDCEISS